MNARASDAGTGETVSLLSVLDLSGSLRSVSGAAAEAMR